MSTNAVVSELKANNEVKLLLLENYPQNQGQLEEFNSEVRYYLKEIGYIITYMCVKVDGAVIIYIDLHMLPVQLLRGC